MQTLAHIPQTGSNHGGLGVASDANFKDIYTSFKYRFNPEKGKDRRKAIQAAGPSGPHGHTYLNLGSPHRSIWAFGTALDWYHH